MADYHVKKVKNPERNLFVAVYDISGKSLKRAEDAGPHPCGTVEEILELDLDVILVATPPVFHYQYGKMVLQTGKHLLLENPCGYMRGGI